MESSSPSPAATTRPGLRLGAADDRPAVSLDGRTWSYRELADLIREEETHALAAAPQPVTATGQPIITGLAMVFAAATAGVPVIVADPLGSPPPTGPPPMAAPPPASPAPEPQQPLALAPPPGTFLIAATSGTSGRPRPVLRSAASWTESFVPLAELAGIGPDDRVLLTGPLHATMHLFAAVHTLALGAEITDLAETATAVHAVPAVLADLVNRLPPTAPLRTAVVAGSALTDEIGDAALARGIAVTEYYGAAELSFVAARRYPAPMRAFPGALIDIRNSGDITAGEAGLPGGGAGLPGGGAGLPGGGAGLPGTLWVRSPYLSLGYPTGVTGPFLRDANGFATVGDLADVTADGDLQIRGRGYAAITTGGATVIAEDVEAALAGLPGVAAVVVVGVPHARLGQVLTAVIEPRRGADLSGLRAAARSLLREQSLPRRWLLADALPRTAGGKIARHPVAQAAAGVARGEPSAGTLTLRPLA